MSALSDVNVIASFVNFLSMTGNLVWSLRLNGIKASGELTSYWKAECEKRDNQIRELREQLQDAEKREHILRTQYTHQLAMTKQHEGELSTYKKFHRHV